MHVVIQQVSAEEWLLPLCSLCTLQASSRVARFACQGHCPAHGCSSPVMHTHDNTKLQCETCFYKQNPQKLLRICQNAYTQIFANSVVLNEPCHLSRRLCVDQALETGKAGSLIAGHNRETSCHAVGIEPFLHNSGMRALLAGHNSGEQPLGRSSPGSALVRHQPEGLAFVPEAAGDWTAVVWRLCFGRPRRPLCQDTPQVCADFSYYEVLDTTVIRCCIPLRRAMLCCAVPMLCHAMVCWLRF